MASALFDCWAHDPAKHAPLLERYVPVTYLAAAVGVDPVDVVIDLTPMKVGRPPDLPRRLRPIRA
jgi:hypothetical protein